MGSSLITGQAVVLGGSIAGLLAAQALADHIEHVVIVERDQLPDGPGLRPGVPQASHVHGLAVRGQREIDRLLPGFTADLVVQGTPVIDFAADLTIRTPFGWGRRFPSSLRAYGASRSLLEAVIRRRVLAHPRVTVRQEQVADGLTGGSGAVTGVRVRCRDGHTLPPIAADLVVDATGRGTRADHWLRELGYPPVPRTEIDAHIGYASRYYCIPAKHRADWQACYVQIGAPHQLRGGMIMPIEGGRWMVTLIGVGADRPGRAEGDFLSFAKSLCSPAIADAIADAEPLTPVTLSRSTSNRRHYLECSTRQPLNFIRVGDAACCFNPIYAQGMSTAAAGASLLARLLADDTAPAAIAPHFHRKLAAVHAPAWLLATTADTRWPHTDGPPATRTMRFAARYTDHILSTAPRDPHVQAAFLDVFNLLRPPRTLLAPSTLIRTLHSALMHTAHRETATQRGGPPAYDRQAPP